MAYMYMRIKGHKDQIKVTSPGNFTERALTHVFQFFFSSRMFSSVIIVMAFLEAITIDLLR